MTSVCSLAPWLSVADGARAIAFYKAAFGATEVYHLDAPGGGVVSRLSVDGAEFWISAEAHESVPAAPPPGGDPIRFILTVPDPDAVFARAVAAGATVVFPVAQGHGWRVGKVVDPFGFCWEIGREVS